MHHLANGTEKHPDTNWNSIDWHQEERRVRNLRQRIFRATQVKRMGIQAAEEGDWGPHFAITLRADLADQLKG